MNLEKQHRVLHALSTGRYKVVDGRLWIFYRGEWKIKVSSNGQHILFGGRGWGHVTAYEHEIVALLNGEHKRENTFRCKIPAHVVKWDTFDSVSLMTAIELYILGFGFTGIARELKKDRSSLVYQVRNILFGVKKSRYLVEEEVLAYRKMYNKEIEFYSRLKFENRYEL
jgi:hypothetical protein